MRQEFIVVAGKRYCYVDQAPIQSQPRGTLLCLHGFPDQWYVPTNRLNQELYFNTHRYGWDNQIAAWSQAGYRVIVPHMLGYGQSVSIHPIH
jgi:soluble epoxide hydrolase / lipid-phosphate phosphatase